MNPASPASEKTHHSPAELLNIDMLSQMMETLFGSANLRISVLDQTGATISTLARTRQYCSYAGDDPESIAKCSQCTRRAVQEVRRTLAPYQYRCHMGLAACIIPVVVERESIAFLLVSGYQMEPEQMELLPRATPQSNLSAGPRDLAGHSDIAYFPCRRVQEMMQLLTSTAQYMAQVGLHTQMLLEMQSRSIDVLTRAHVQALEEKRMWQEKLRARSFNERQEFLFDAMNLICFSAEQEGAEQTARMLQILSEHLRRIGGPDNLVTMGEELAWLGRYFSLLEHMYAGRITFTVEEEGTCDPEVLFAQPPSATLVSLALRRGMAQRKEGGRICLRLSCSKGGVQLTVNDNGPVIPPTLLRQIGRLQPPREHEVFQVLVHTVQELRTHFGSSFRWNITSSHNAGTTITMCYPIQEVEG